MTDSSPAGVATPVRMIHISEVLENPKISSSARVLYAILRQAVGRDGTVAMYARDLAARLGCSETNVGNLNAELRAHHLIATRGQGTGRPLKYTLLSAAIAAGAAVLHGAMHISGYSDSARRNVRGPQENSDSASAGSDFSGTPAPSDSPNRELLYKHHHVIAPAREPDVLALQEIGVTTAVAEQLAVEFPERCRAQVAWLQWRTGVKDPAAYVVKAIRGDYAMPHRVRQLQARDADLRAKAAELDREADRHLELQAERASNAMLESLPAEIKYRVEQQVELKITGLFGGRPIKTEVLRGMKRGFMLEAVREFRATGEIGGAK